MAPKFVCVVLYCGSNFQLNICRYVDYEAQYINLIDSVLHKPQAMYSQNTTNKMRRFSIYLFL